MTLTAWALTTGEAGMRTQARGLATAVAEVVIEKIARGRAPWPWRPTADALAPPWPDILVSCGRRSVDRAISVRKASGGSTLLVHVQDPRRRVAAFDLVVAMQHDKIPASERVIKVSTALHDLTRENLAAAGLAWAERFAALPRPLAGVIVGGNVRGRRFTLADGTRLLEGLRRLRREAGAGLAITPSRRTPEAIRALLAQAFARDEGVFLWDQQGENPYRAILSLSDRLIVTSDSISMVSEALSAPHPLEVFDLGSPRHRAFLKGLLDSRLVRLFDGAPSPPSTNGPINATESAARAVRALIQARTGVSG